MHYGDRIKKYRELRGLTQDELARLVEMPATAISRMENGLRKVTLEEAIRFAEAFDISLEMLAGITRSRGQDLGSERSERVRKLHSALTEAMQELQELEEVLAS